MPLLRDYTAEHERVVNFGGDAVRALDAGDLDRARDLAGRLADELRSHWRGEEDGLFAQLLDTEHDLFVEYIDPLVAEHRELGAFLASMDLADPADGDRFRDAVFALHLHIAKEEDALFPASVTTLDGDQWDAAIAAWHRAHPGEKMLETGI
ncbi:hemerythrin domain-containing protein [Gordonia sp. zg691]|uniref:hemerythrin domain-containing protein n=1 Tax=Gordonia jinghuaiqii TaxID=2758710 RepID=UPI00166262B5|nr:hemerythrin domain-containing protein [Gordonia jinghuaiqii]MBD0860142.1 hemerythrin domain-containing protein [Gordonia jinghuaiqii]